MIQEVDMYTIGIDLGGTNIAAAIVNEKGEMIIKASVPTSVESGYEVIVKDMADLCLSLLKQVNIDISDIHSVGIGSPGNVNSETGVIIYSCNLNFEDVYIIDEFHKHIDIPVHIGNDANVAAFGEYEVGIGKAYKDFIAITLGTGVGSGVILNGKIIGGTWNGGAEIGHTVIQVDGVPCPCGRKGCWEQYSSATGLIRQAKDAARENLTSLLNKLMKDNEGIMTAKIPFDAAQSGDEVAQKVIDKYIDYLAIGLGNVVNIFQPESIAIGGGVSAQKDNLILPLRERMIKEVYGGKESFLTKIEVAQLGNDAGIIGAAMLYKLQTNVS